MLIKKGRIYRLITLTIAFLVLGMAAFLPLFASDFDESTRLAIWIVFWVYLGIYVVTLVGNEIYIAIRKRRGDGNLH